MNFFFCLGLYEKKNFLVYRMLNDNLLFIDDIYYLFYNFYDIND